MSAPRAHTWSKCSMKQGKPQRANQMVGASWKSSNRNIPACLWPVTHAHRPYSAKINPKYSNRNQPPTEDTKKNPHNASDVMLHMYKLHTKTTQVEPTLTHTDCYSVSFEQPGAAERFFGPRRQISVFPSASQISLDSLQSGPLDLLANTSRILCFHRLPISCLNFPGSHTDAKEIWWMTSIISSLV